MTKLISSIAAIVFATATLAGAAPRQGGIAKAGAGAQAKTVKSAKPANRKLRKGVPAKSRKTAAAQRPVVQAQTKPVVQAQTRPVVQAQNQAAQESVGSAKHDLETEEQELKSLKANLKTAQKAGDWQRVSRDRRELYRLEAHIRADKADLQDERRVSKADGRESKAGRRESKAEVKKRTGRIPFWGWWRRS